MFHLDNIKELINARDKCWVTEHRALGYTVGL